MNPEPFTLTRQPARRRRQLKILPKGNDRQGVLFTGADTLPGQKELFTAPRPARERGEAHISVDAGGWWWIDLAGDESFDACRIGDGVDGVWLYDGKPRESIEGAFETRNMALEFLEAMR